MTKRDELIAPGGVGVTNPDREELIAERAEPADAAMREALDAALCVMKDLRDGLHHEPSVQGRKWVHLGSSLNDAIRKAELALTAPGATTKSDGGDLPEGDAVLAAGLVADEAAIRAAEREKCAPAVSRFEERVNKYVTQLNATGQADLAHLLRRDSDALLAAIRSGDVA